MVLSLVFFYLLGIAYRTRFTDNGNLHLSRIGHFILYLFGYFTGKVFCSLIVNLVRTDDYAQFTSCLDGVGLRYARIRHYQLFEVVETLDVGFYNFAACSRTCA